MIPTQGHLRIHVLNAELTRKVGGPLHCMDPFVHLHVGQFQNWRSTVCNDGGKTPRWPAG